MKQVANTVVYHWAMIVVLGIKFFAFATLVVLAVSSM